MDSPDTIDTSSGPTVAGMPPTKEARSETMIVRAGLAAPARVASGERPNILVDVSGDRSNMFETAAVSVASSTCDRMSVKSSENSNLERQRVIALKKKESLDCEILAL